MNIDLTNGLFEIGGALFVLNHCRVLYHDKTVKGFSLISVAYFTAWGIWNLFYYPSLNQFWSTVGGVSLVIANAIWVFLIIYYKYFTAQVLPTYIKDNT